MWSIWTGPTGTPPLRQARLDTVYYRNWTRFRTDSTANLTSCDSWAPLFRLEPAQCDRPNRLYRQVRDPSSDAGRKLADLSRVLAPAQEEAAA